MSYEVDSVPQWKLRQASEEWKRGAQRERLLRASHRGRHL